MIPRTKRAAQKCRNQIVNAAKNFTDDEAIAAIWMYPLFEAGMTVSCGDRVCYDGSLYRCIAPEGEPISLSPDWTPTNAPSLFAKVLPGQEDTPIGEWIQPDSTNPYMTGDECYYNEKRWRSTCDNNVWAPGVYGWEEV